MPESEPRARPTSGRLTRALQRLFHPRLVILETMRPVEVPVLTETKRRWLAGDRNGAILYAYEAVLDDLQRAYGVRYPPDWTHDDILAHGVTPEMEPLVPFLKGLHDLYLPIRYGGAVPESGPSPDRLVQSVYAQRAMWGLYVEGVRRDDVRALPRSDAGRAAEASEVSA
ncbi:MAG: hypothetical protein L3J87_00550 [Thermoplasmata archaeon]|nr:hypothetical protein [Thermoplasmata archaeon]MCI4344102.1 hypothetical protein [Thermoplasmata archaeon]